MAFLNRISELNRDRLVGYAAIAMLSGLMLFDTQWSRAVFYFGFLPAIILAIDWRGLPDLSASRLFKFVVVYGVVGLSSFYWRDVYTPIMYEDMAKFLNVGLALVVGMIVFSRHPDWIEPLFRAVGLIAAVGIIVAVAIHWNDVSPGWRFPGTGGINPNLLASTYGATALGVLFIVMSGKRPGTPGLFWAATLSILVIGLWLTGSRGPLLAFVVAALVGLALRSPLKAALAALGLVGFVALAASNNVIDLTTMTARGDSYRLTLWRESFTLALERPWFGYGFGNRFELGLDVGLQSTMPHNIFLSHLLLGGVIWLATFVAVLAEAFREGWKQHQCGTTGPLVLLTFGLGCMMADFHTLFTHLSAEWLIFWLPIAALSAYQLRSQQRSAVPKSRNDSDRSDMKPDVGATTSPTSVL